MILTSQVQDSYCLHVIELEQLRRSGESKMDMLLCDKKYSSVDWMKTERMKTPRRDDVPDGKLPSWFLTDFSRCTSTTYHTDLGTDLVFR